MNEPHEEQGESPTRMRFGSSLRHRSARPGKGAIAASIAMHALAVGAFVFAGLTGRTERLEFQTVAINLVSPPPTVQGPPEPVETTAPVVTPPEPKPVEKPPVEKPKPTTQAATPKPVVSKPKDAKPAQGENPKPGPVGGEDLDIVQEGVPFPYPEYLEKIVRQLPRYMRWTGSRTLAAEVQFSIRRDGSVGDINLVRSSGNMDFDEKAVDAVENAGRARFAGALPEGYQNPKLFISFTFKSAN